MQVLIDNELSREAQVNLLRICVAGQLHESAVSYKKIASVLGIGVDATRALCATYKRNQGDVYPTPEAVTHRVIWCRTPQHVKQTLLLEAKLLAEALNVTEQTC